MPRSTLSKVRKSTALPTPPVGGLFNSFISSISKRNKETGMKVPVEAAIRLSILAHLNLRGKYLAVGTSRATPEIIWVRGYARGLRSASELYAQIAPVQSSRQLMNFHSYTFRNASYRTQLKIRSVVLGHHNQHSLQESIIIIHQMQNVKASTYF